MKHIKLFEATVNYKIGVFTIKEANELYSRFIENNELYNLKGKIHYFSYDDFSDIYSSDKHSQTCRFIVAYNDDDILGICKFAYWESSKNYAISYLSINKDFFSMGISKKILEKLFEYFSETYPKDTLNFSGYSIDGWKYLRKNILDFSKKYNVKISEKAIEYPGIKGSFSDDDRKLMNKSREDINKEYGLNYYLY